jgi:putative ABC transport system permease protein
METVLQDLRYGAHMLVKQPGFTLVAVITLALGISANSAIFSVVNAVLLRPLSYRESDRLMMLNHNYPKLDLKATVSAVGYQYYRRTNKSFEDLFAFAGWAANLTGDGDPERLQGITVTASFFSTLGAEMARGRSFNAAEEMPGHNHVVVLSDGLWRRRFGADPSLVGKTLLLNGESYSVIGIAKPDFQFGREFGMPIELYSPLSLTPAQLDPARWRNEYLTVIARLKPVVTMEQAQAEMDIVAGNVRRQYFGGQDADDPRSWGLLLRSMRELVVGDIRPALLVLLGAVGLVLLIACANVANLLLARAALRRKEIAIRSALGARRMRVIRQLLTESVLLAFVGGAAGVLLADWGMRTLISLNPDKLPRAYEIGLDTRVLLFTLGISLLTGIIFGLVPALQTAGGDLHDTLKEGGRSGSSRRGMRGLLVVTEVALTLILSIGAGLLIKSFQELQRVNPGFRPDHLLVMQVSLPASKYRDPQQVDGFYQQALSNIRALPGVQAADISTTVPMSGNNSSGSFSIEGRTVAPGEMSPWGNRWFVGATYFQTMKVPLLRGRYFDEHDVGDAKQVAILDETMARKFWATGDPVGKRISFQSDTQGNVIWREVVGVVGHVKHKGLEGESPVQYYIPLRQIPVNNVFLAVRTEVDPASLTSSVRDVIRALDRELPVFKVTTMERLVADSMVQRRFVMILLGIFALVALLLAAVGLYGVMSYSVARRTNEFGIRLALGAQVRDVLGMVVGQGMKLAGIGLAAGLIGTLVLSLAMTRVINGLLFSVQATDPLTYVTAPLVLALVALAACYLPARRATRVDPVVALRYE